MQTLPETHLESLRSIESGYWWYEARLRWALKLIGPWVKKRKTPFEYVDLGCGTGGFAKNLTQILSPSKMTLVDGDLNLVDRLRSEGFRTKLVDFANEEEALPVQADLITCMDVLEHIKNDLGFLEKIFASLHPKGLLVLSVPAYPLLFSSWDQQLGHFRRYRKQPLLKLLKTAGFENIRIYPMWSFLFPAGLLRKTFTSPKTEFPRVSEQLNRTLLRCSDLEWKFRRVLPLGTSLILSAHKK